VIFIFIVIKKEENSCKLYSVFQALIIFQHIKNIDVTPFMSFAFQSINIMLEFLLNFSLPLRLVPTLVSPYRPGRGRYRLLDMT
jgi:hypothetical protein